MSIEGLRDLAIIIFAFVGTAVLVLGAIISVPMCRKITSTLDNLNETSRNFKDVSLLIKDEIAKPLVQIACVVQGVRQGMELVKQFMHIREEGGKQ